MPTRTGADPRQPGRCGSSRSVRSRSPPMPNMICRSPDSLEGAGREGGHRVEELVRLVGAGRHPQRLDGERGVAHPRVAVVPVPVTADHLGQRGRRRGADRAGGLERQRLQHAPAVVDQIAPRPDVRLVQLRPRLPRRHRVVEPRRDLRLAPHPGARRSSARRAVVQCEARLLPFVEHEPARGRRPLDRQRSHRARQQQDVGTAGREQPSVDGVEHRHHESVLGPRDVLHLDLDLARGARHLPEQEMRCAVTEVVTAVPLPRRQRVDDDRGPGRSRVTSSPAPWCDRGSDA